MNNQRKSGSILIVDDERGQRDILKLILRKEGYDIVDVPGVGEALEQLGPILVKFG